MPEKRKMPSAKFNSQTLSKHAKFKEFGTKNAKLAILARASVPSEAGGRARVIVGVRYATPLCSYSFSVRTPGTPLHPRRAPTHHTRD